jgi:hypothetical protein
MTAGEENLSIDALRIVEKYEAFVTYLYPIMQCSPRRHCVLRDIVLTDLFEPIGDLYKAARSRQLSRLYTVDAEFATLRSYLRFLAKPGIRIITPDQHKTALALLSEPGKMLGAWQRKLNRSGQASVDDGSGAQMRPKGQAGKR